MGQTDRTSIQESGVYETASPSQLIPKLAEKHI